MALMRPNREELTFRDYRFDTTPDSYFRSNASLKEMYVHNRNNFPFELIETDLTRGGVKHK